MSGQVQWENLFWLLGILGTALGFGIAAASWYYRAQGPIEKRIRHNEMRIETLVLKLEYMQKQYEQIRTERIADVARLHRRIDAVESKVDLERTMKG